MGLIARDARMTGIAPRALIVDDEPSVSSVGLKIMLRTAGYVVETARTALDARDRGRSPSRRAGTRFRAAGWSWRRGLHARTAVSELPILIMSAIGEEREKVRALECRRRRLPREAVSWRGALARLKGSSCNGQRAASSTLEIGELVIDPPAGE